MWANCCKVKSQWNGYQLRKESAETTKDPYACGRPVTSPVNRGGWYWLMLVDTVTWWLFLVFGFWFCGEKEKISITCLDSWFLILDSWFLILDSISRRYFLSLLSSHPLPSPSCESFGLDQARTRTPLQCRYWYKSSVQAKPNPSQINPILNSSVL